MLAPKVASKTTLTIKIPATAKFLGEKRDGFLTITISPKEYEKFNTPLLMPRAPGVPRSCQMDGRTTSTNIGS